MEVSDQLHASAALALSKPPPPQPTGLVAGWAQEPGPRDVGREKSVPLQGIEQWSSSQ